MTGISHPAGQAAARWTRAGSPQRNDLYLFSVAKMPCAGEDHGDVSFVGGSNDFRIFHGTARLNGSGRASFRGGDQTIGKREERVTAHDAALQRELCLSGFP